MASVLVFEVLVGLSIYDPDSSEKLGMPSKVSSVTLLFYITEWEVFKLECTLGYIEVGMKAMCMEDRVGPRWEYHEGNDMNYILTWVNFFYFGHYSS